MKVKTVIAKILRMEGVEYAACFPGNPLFDPYAEEGIRPILFRNENVAAHAADSFTRASFGKRTGLLLVMQGPGIEVAFPGIRQAASDNIPMLVMTAAEPSRRITTPPYFDAAATFRPLVKYAETVYFPERTVEIMRRAFTQLRMGKPGTVLIALPKDVANMELTDELFEYRPVKSAKTAADPADITAAAKILLSAKNPVIRAGQGMLYAQAWDELKDLAEYLQIPVASTLNSKSVFPEDHPLSLGCGGRGHPGTVEHFYDEADVVFAAASSCLIDDYIYTIPPGKRLIQLTLDERDINKDYPVEQAIIGDAKLAMGQLREEVKKQTKGESRPRNDALVKKIKTVHEEWLKSKWLDKLTSSEKPIHPYRVYWDIMKALDRKETILVPDSGTPRDALTAFWQALIPGGFIGFGKDHMLGSGLGLALGAKLARPDRTVVHIGGDAAFGQTGMDWETAVREKIPIINVVLNNGMMSGTHKSAPIASERYHINRLSGNYSKMAEGMGSYTEKVENPEDIIPAVQRAKKITDSGAPALLEFMTRLEENEPT